MQSTDSTKSRKSHKSISSPVYAPELESLQQINLNAAGLDVGVSEIYACIPQGRDEHSVRVFATFTADLQNLAAWLAQCKVTSVAMESTGVYWIPIFQILEAQGFEVILVNAHQVKNVPGHKTDVLDCQWIQQLHTFGLLRASFRPEDAICVLRSFVRQREMLLQYRASHIQHIQKALEQMNLKLNNVLSDVAGVTGLRIIRDIIAGMRDPIELAKHRDWRCGKSQAEIAKSLVGDYRVEHVFALQQAVELYDCYTEKLQACDAQIEQHFACFSCQVDLEKHPLPPPTRRPCSPQKNQPKSDLRLALYKLVGIDLTQVDGLDVLSVQTILSEIGTDMSKWRTVKQFTSWLGLCPHNDKTGGKIKRTHTKKTNNRANLAFRQAAASLWRSKSALGHFYRRMRTKLGAPQAVVATAHRLARIVYHMLKYQVPFAAVPPEQEDAQYRQRALRQLQRKAKQLGATLVMESTLNSTDPSIEAVSGV
ncbi:IS110 family transposase [Trichocoleus desertorum AS-A10]|uniref:IS110 family transposase n=1 Tax=Trichocoleus desertorum TaxID=1481672 RepID=UPI0032967EEE